MIKINLTPKEELENPLWYVPDIAFAVLVCATCYLGVQYYLGMQRDVIEKIHTETSLIAKSTSDLEADMVRLEEATKELALTNEKIVEIKPLTGTQIARYMPIIVIEHLQNLKPDGLWFRGLEFVNASREVKMMVDPNVQQQTGAEAKTEDVAKVENPPQDLSQVILTGYAFDNLLVAEFLTALRATQTQEVDASDVRTLVYFSEVTLISTEQKPSNAAFNHVVSANDLDEPVFSFEISLRFARNEAPSGVGVLTSQSVFPVNADVQLAER